MKIAMHIQTSGLPHAGVASEMVISCANPAIVSSAPGGPRSGKPSLVHCVLLAFLWIMVVPCLRAAPVANAGPDQTNALEVPVILDASGSTGASRYLWEQISGLPLLEVIGQDRRKALVVSVTNAGTYRFRLTAYNGADVATDEVILQFLEPSGRTIFVDYRLTANCLNTNYSIARRDGSGKDAVAYTTIQAAANVSLPGDQIFVRGGTYSNALVAGVNQQVVSVTRSGTSTAPVHYIAYGGETVLLWGLGYEDRDLDGDTFAEGPFNPSKREVLLRVDADYVIVKGFALANSGGYGLRVTGSYCYVSECIARDNWGVGFLIYHLDGVHTVTGSVMRWVEGHNNRHGNGAQFQMDNKVYGFTTACAFVDGLFYNNGYEPSGNKVLPVSYDPAGGGNCDGVGSSKYHHDSAYFYPEYGVDNWGPDNFLIRNIAYHNADDGFDTSFADSLVEGNMSLNNGPEGRKGYKMLRSVRGMIFRGNLAFGNHSVGFELRGVDGGLPTVIHDSAIRNGAQGFLGVGGGGIVVNNLGGFNAGRDIVNPSTDNDNNWAMDGGGVPAGFSGNPRLQKDSFQINMGFEPNWSVRQKWEFVERQVREALSPTPGSGLIDRGQLVPGYHCPRADDDPMSPMPKSAPGRHWYGRAPDIGAFEYIPAKVLAPRNLRANP